MSATELATVIEGWATLAGLFVVIAGAAFAGVQLRADAKARKLQAMMAVLADIRPYQVGMAQNRVLQLPDGFDFSSLSEADRDDVLIVLQSCTRLGNLLEAGLVSERDIFPHVGLSSLSVAFWEKVKHVIRDPSESIGTGWPNPAELLAARAQKWLVGEGVTYFRNISNFDADIEALNEARHRAQASRPAAS